MKSENWNKVGSFSKQHSKAYFTWETGSLTQEHQEVLLLWHQDIRTASGSHERLFVSRVKSTSIDVCSLFLSPLKTQPLRPMVSFFLNHKTEGGWGVDQNGIILNIPSWNGPETSSVVEWKLRHCYVPYTQATAPHSKTQNHSRVIPLAE